MTVAFPKPKDVQQPSVVVRVCRGGREVCNQQTRAGSAEYRSRTLAMLERQGGRCCLEMHAPMCPGRLAENHATFDHEAGRGSGGSKRDDRIVLPDGTWQNGACHASCNNWKASRYIPYNRSFQR